jgi:hypothetical protein
MTFIIGAFASGFFCGFGAALWFVHYVLNNSEIGPKF